MGTSSAFHDPLLRIATDLDGWAHRTPTDRILDCRLLDRLGEPSDQHPLSLHQALDLIPPELPLQLDVKAYADPQLAYRTARSCCEVVARHGSADRIEVISFFTEACIAAVRGGVAARLVIWADYTPHELANGLVSTVSRGSPSRDSCSANDSTSRWSKPG